MTFTHLSTGIVISLTAGLAACTKEPVTFQIQKIFGLSAARRSRSVRPASALPTIISARYMARMPKATEEQILNQVGDW